MKKLISLIATSALLLTLAGCKDDTATNESDNITSNSNNTNTAILDSDVITTDNVTTTDSVINQETEITEPAEPVITPDFAYWDMLTAEYDANKDNISHKACVVDNIAIWQGRDDNRREDICIIHNLDTKETKTIEMMYSVYHNGYIYGKTNDKLVCYDLDGNLVKSIGGEANLNTGFYKLYFTSDGNIVTNYGQLVSADFKTVTNITLNVDIGHGKTKEITSWRDYDIICVYDNKIYVNYGSNSYTIDLNTFETVKLDYTIPYAAANDENYTIGKYHVETTGNRGLFDITTGKKLSDIVLINYAEHSQYWFVSKANNIYKCIMPNNLEELKISKEDYLKENGQLVSSVELFLERNAVFLSDNYFVITDSTGTYLQNIETGEETEIIFE